MVKPPTPEPTYTKHQLSDSSIVDRSADTGNNRFDPHPLYGNRYAWTESMNAIGGQGLDLFKGGAGHDWFMDSGGGVEAHGGQGNDFLAAGKTGHEKVVLNGGGWNDVLQGSLSGAFNDRLDGGEGNDRLIAGRYTGNRVEDAFGHMIGTGRSEGKYNSLTGGSDGDFFILNEESYVFVEDYVMGQDAFMVTGLHGGADSWQPEHLKVVHLGPGARAYGEQTFRIVLDDGTGPPKVLAEVNVTNYRFGTDPQQVIDHIQGGITFPHADLMLGAYLNGTLGADALTGTAGHDEIWGFSGDDTLRGAEGNDRMYGGAGHDTLHGDEGDDLMVGHNGHDTMFGGRGRDFLSGNSGNDQLYGGRGNDQLEGDGGNDRLDGGEGTDTLTGGDGKDVFVVKANADGSADVIKDFIIIDDVVRLPYNVRRNDVSFVKTTNAQGHTVHNLVYLAGKLDEKVLAQFEHMDGEDLSKVKFIWDLDPNAEAPPGETINGTNRKDLLFGAQGGDTIKAKSGNDVAHGRGGDDTIDGGKGNDTLYGEHGNDNLFGKAGRDILYGGGGGGTIPSTAATAATGSREVMVTTSSGAERTTTRSTAARATTASMATVATTRSTAARATTSLRAARAMTGSRAARATTSSTAAKATTGCSATMARTSCWAARAPTSCAAAKGLTPSSSAPGTGLTPSSTSRTVPTASFSRPRPTTPRPRRPWVSPT